MQIEVRPGGYRDHTSSNHLVVSGLSDELRAIGYTLRRVEVGESYLRPAINVNLSPALANPEVDEVPVALRVEPYNAQSALNATVTLVGLKDFLSRRFAFRRVPEFAVRAFIPNLDGGYIGPDEADEPVPPASSAVPADTRPRVLVMRAIRARRGTKTFRDGQLARFGGRCAISSCSVVDVLEAAHIRAYRQEADNVPPNGVLLRADLHTLFDLDLIAINPDTYRVAVHDRLAGSEYQAMAGRAVAHPADGFDAQAVRDRWALFNANTPG